jgi:hypothetical protein
MRRKELADDLTFLAVEGHHGFDRLGGASFLSSARSRWGKTNDDENNRDHRTLLHDSSLSSCCGRALSGAFGVRRGHSTPSDAAVRSSSAASLVQRDQANASRKPLQVLRQYLLQLRRRTRQTKQIRSRSPSFGRVRSRQPDSGIGVAEMLRQVLAVQRCHPHASAVAVSAEGRSRRRADGVELTEIDQRLRQPCSSLCGRKYQPQTRPRGSAHVRRLPSRPCSSPTSGRRGRQRRRLCSGHDSRSRRLRQHHDSVGDYIDVRGSRRATE